MRINRQKTVTKPIQQIRRHRTTNRNGFYISTFYVNIDHIDAKKMYKQYMTTFCVSFNTKCKFSTLYDVTDVLAMKMKFTGRENAESVLGKTNVLVIVFCFRG